ncbi:MAG: diguanylate cyclase domain-containing protein [Steroidobacteraceae bacterium]
MTAPTGWPAVHAEASQLLSALVGDLCGAVQLGGGREGGPVDAPAARAKLHRLARVARTRGLSSFASIVLRLAERLEPCLRAGAFAPRDLEQFRCVAAHCGRYLDDPTDMQAAAALVEALGAGPDPAAGRWERNQLLQGVFEEATELIRSVGAAPDAGGHDGLAGLLDRDALRARLQGILTAAGSSHLPVGVMAVGIDGVEDIVDSLGEQLATAVVASAARELICAVPCGEGAARLGTDRFVVVRTGLNALELAEEAARLIEIICRSRSRSRSRRLGGHLVSVSARIGLAVAGQHGSSAADLLANANAALHEARARRLYKTQFFAPHMRRAALRRVSLEARLRTAIE